MDDKKIAVLMGGWSSERPVSLVSGKAVADACRELGLETIEIDVSRDIFNQLKAVKPDIAFNALHGTWGEDGRIQSVLEILEIPYTHSNVLSSALAMDKDKTKVILAANGIDVPSGKIMNRFEAAKAHPMPTPYVVKPNADGSSFGVFIVRSGENRPPEALLDDDWKCGDDILVEEFIKGREFSCAVMGGKALAVTEIITDHEFYDFEAKYGKGGSRHVINPSDLPSEVRERMMKDAVTAHNALGCKGVTRTDFRYDPETGRVVALELNNQPGMTPTSLAPEQAASNGISFKEFVKWMLEDALCPQ